MGRAFPPNHFKISCLAMALLFLLSSCTEKDLEATITSSSLISGKIENFSSLSSLSNSAQSCTSGAVQLYKLNSNGDKIVPAIATADLTADGNFTFNLKSSSVSFSNQAPTEPLLISLENCSEILNRPVTGKKEQNITHGTTLMAYLLNSPQKNKLPSALQSQRDQMIDLLSVMENAGTLQLAYQALTNSASASAEFQSLFGVPPSVLTQATPQILSMTWPASTTPTEQAAITGAVAVSHWSPSYNAAYLWKIDGNSISSSNNLNYTLSANSQGMHTLSLYVGQNDGSGGVDTTKPYQVLSKVLTIPNNVPPQPLNFVVTSPANTINPINTRNLTLSLATGGSLSNCGSFSNLALTEESFLAPLASDFTISCSQAFTQNLSYSLLSTGDGTKTLRLWAIDAAGNISATSTSVSVILDTTAPTVSISSQPNSITNSTSANFAFSGTDAGGLDHYECRIDAGSFATCTSPQTISGLSAGAHTFYVKAYDLAGNISAIASYSWTIDLSPPTISISTPASNGGVIPAASLSSYLLAGSCSEDGRNVQISGAASATTTCNSGTWSTNINLSSAAEGSISVTATTTDAAGNSTTTAARSFIKDSTLPSLSVTTPSATRGNGSYGNVSWTLTEANVASSTNFSVELYNGISWVALSNVAAASGANSSQSYSLSNFTVPNVDTNAAKIRITLTDAAGNTTTAQSNAFIIDSTPPTISSFTLAGGSATTALPSVTTTISASDNLTGVSQMQFSESASVGTNWQSYSATGSFTLSQTNGTKTVYAWAKDAVGNVSVSIADNIDLDFGNPPTVSITQPTSGSSYTVGNTVHVEWSCSSSNGLDASPARLSYTVDDGLNFSSISGWITNNLTSTTGSYDWTLPGGVVVFRLLAECKSAAGVVSSAYSAPLNTGGWTIFAGDPSSMSENVSLSVALMSRSTSGYQSMAGDIDGNIFFEKGRAIFKIDAQTGLVTRYVGDPNYTGGLCNITAGQSPVNNSSFDKLNGNPYIIGSSPDRRSIYFSICGKTWSMNTSTNVLSQINTSAYNNGAGFLSPLGKFFYYNNGRLWKVDLTQVNAAPVAIFGNSTSCAYPVAGVGTQADQTPILGINDGTCAGENYLFTNADESKIWVGNWDGFGRSTNTVRLDYDGASGKYLIGSTNVGWSFSWDQGNCVASRKTNRVFCSGRWAVNNYTSFDTSIATWTSVAMGRNAFIRFAPTLTGMVSLDSTNFVMAHIENSDGTITRSQIGGSNIEAYGNGTDITKVAFSSVDDITYSTGASVLYARTAGGLRSISMPSYPTVSIGTPNWVNPGSSWNRLTVNASGTRILFPPNWCGQLGFAPYSVSGATISNLANFYSILGCNSGTRLAHPIADNTLISGNNFGWENLSGQNDRAVLHSNGKQYLTVKNGTNDVIIYSSDRTTLSWIAGRAGAGGYDPLDSGNNAKTALLKTANWMMEIPSGLPNTGDLLLLDGTRLRMITITTSSATPKIYDILDLGTLTGYPAGATITDFWYDFSSEISNGTNNVIGSGKMYFTTSANNVYKVTPTTVSGNSVTAATLSQYSFTGATFSGTVRIALTPAGLLVTQPNKSRILKVAP